MRDLSHLNAWRKPHPVVGLLGDEHNGLFKISKNGIIYKVIASDGLEWDHISVTLMRGSHKAIKRTPTWEEMSWLKDLFFKPQELVIQYHPPKDDNVNCHNWCLHLWRPHNHTIPMPPKETIA